jgi:YjbE family integral membrane protein
LQLDDSLNALGPVLQIGVIDLLLSGDNAVVIALACRGLPRRLWRQAVLLGTAAAIVLRVLLTGAAALILGVAYVKLVGGALLMVIAVQLLGEDEPVDKAPEPARDNLGIWKSIGIIIAADTVMSLDNVLAVAAASRGSLALLAFGLVLSIPILVFGSALVARILQRYPIVVLLGAAQLGWIAGGTAAADPAIAPWIAQLPAGAGLAAPAACALYVLTHGLITRNWRS